jgi:hypothetical protein
MWHTAAGARMKFDMQFSFELEGRGHASRGKRFSSTRHARLRAFVFQRATILTFLRRNRTANQ